MTPKAHPEKMQPATSLKDAANAENSAMGYAAVNDPAEHADIARLAYHFYEKRQSAGRDGNAEDDWYRAEHELQQRRSRR